MNLYLLTKERPWGYDVVIQFLIRTDSEERARKIASESVDDEDQDWLDSEKTYCRVITEEGPQEVIVVHFRPG